MTKTGQPAEEVVEAQKAPVPAPLPTTAEYDRIATFLRDLRAEGGHTWPLDGERLLTYIGRDAWILCVNHERAVAGLSSLVAHEALAVRAEIFETR